MNNENLLIIIFKLSNYIPFILKNFNLDYSFYSLV